MMNEVRFADLMDNLSKMNESQLLTLAEAASDRIIERRGRFTTLCENLARDLQILFDEFPNATVPLGGIDLMDHIVPEDFVDSCEIGD